MSGALDERQEKSRSWEVVWDRGQPVDQSLASSVALASLLSASNFNEDKQHATGLLGFWQHDEGLTQQ